MNLANRITLIRIILIPIFIVLLIQGHNPWPAVIFTFTIVTDALDGFIARWKKQKTALGAFLDPLADKLLMFSSFLALTYLKIIPLWIFVVILSRDILIVLGWVLVYFLYNSKEVKPRFFGKLTTVLQMSTVWLILLGLADPWKMNFLVVTVVITSVSCLDYIIDGSRRLGKHS